MAWSSAGSSPRPSPGSSPEAIPYPFEFQLLDEDWEHFSVLMESAVHRMPVLERRRHPQVLQRSRELHARQPVRAGRVARTARASSSAPGFNSVGIASAGGAGRALAEWVVEGEPTTTWSASTSAGSRRSTRNTPWLRERVAEVLGLHYAVPWPNRELETGAAVPLLAAARPARRRRRRVRARRWAGSGRTSFAPDRAGGRPATTPGAGRPGSAGRPRSSAPPARRWRVFDQTSFSQVRRARARTRSAALQWVCAADVDVPVGAASSTRRCSTRAAPTRPT